MNSKTILVIDDSPANLKLIRVLLTVEGYQVLTAHDAESALTFIATFHPDLILMDLQLPGMDGLTLTRRLKSEPRYTQYSSDRDYRVCDEGRRRQSPRSGLRRLCHQAHRYAGSTGSCSIVFQKHSLVLKRPLTVQGLGI